MFQHLRRSTGPIEVRRLGTVEYEQALELQMELVGQRERDEIPDTLLLLEHPAVYTLGRRADLANVVFDGQQRAELGIGLHQTDRGGDVTYHGPGQLVGYPIFRLSGPRVVDFVRMMEEINIQVAATYDIRATRVDGYSGVWVGNEKLTAVGVHVTASGVTYHGWATNVNPDLAHFSGIVPCGIEDRGVCSFESLGIAVTVDDVAATTVDVLTAVAGS